MMEWLRPVSVVPQEVNLPEPSEPSEAPLAPLELSPPAEASPTLPFRFALLPIDALGISPRAAEALGNAGYTSLADLDGVSPKVMAALPGVSAGAASRIPVILDRIREGEWDPTLQTAETLPEELMTLLDACRLPDVARGAEVLDLTYGFRERPPLTLEEAGSRLGLTRERVRQIRERTERSLQCTLRWMPTRSTVGVRQALACRHGLAHIDELATAVPASMGTGDYDARAYLAWLLPLAADPAARLTEGGLIVGPPVGMRRFALAGQTIDALLACQRAVTLATATERIAPVWSPVDQIGQDALTRHVRLLLSVRAQEVLPDVFSAHRWGKAEWAEWILQEERGPLHFREVAARVNRLTGKQYDLVSFNSLLNADPRFTRVGAGDFSLAAWGAQGYGRFDEVIQRYLTEREQPEPEQRIADDLLSIYTVQETTVTAMLRTRNDIFVHFGGGYWGLAGVAYTVDVELERQIEYELSTAATPMTVDELRRRIVFARGGTHPLPTEEVLRVLYVSPRFRRFGNLTPQRFVLVPLSG